MPTLAEQQLMNELASFTPSFKDFDHYMDLYYQFGPKRLEEILKSKGVIDKKSIKDAVLEVENDFANIFADHAAKNFSEKLDSIYTNLKKFQPERAVERDLANKIGMDLLGTKPGTSPSEPHPAFTEMDASAPNKIDQLIKDPNARKDVCFNKKRKDKLANRLRHKMAPRMAATHKPKPPGAF